MSTCMGFIFININKVFPASIRVGQFNWDFERNLQFYSLWQYCILFTFGWHIMPLAKQLAVTKILLNQCSSHMKSRWNPKCTSRREPQDGGGLLASHCESSSRVHIKDSEDNHRSHQFFCRSFTVALEQYAQRPTSHIYWLDSWFKWVNICSNWCGSLSWEFKNPPHWLTLHPESFSWLAKHY